jgi:hypothetical protein
LLIEDFNKYYREKGNSSKKKKKPTNAYKVEHYNRIVTKTESQLERIKFYARLNPPEEWEWIYVDGKETASWVIWESKSGSWSINLSAYGGLFAVNKAGEPLSNADVCIEKINSIGQKFKVRGECDLFDISNSISERRVILGLSSDNKSSEDSKEDLEKKAKKYHSSK